MTGSLRKYYSYIFALPSLAIFIIFFIIPTVTGALLSFTYWDPFSIRLAGLDNYIEFFKNPDMNIAIKNTIIFAVVTTVCKVGLGLLLAAYLNRSMKAAKFLRSVYFLPCVISNVAVGVSFSSIFHPDGALNSLFRFVGLDIMTRNWLTDRSIVIYSIAAIEIWRWTGFTMVILLAGMQTIPKSLYESAEVDGVTQFQKLRYITLPLIMPAFNNALIINLIGGLKVFDLVYVCTQGGPGNASQVLNSYVYKAFGNGWYGESCAAAVVVGVMVTVITLLTYGQLRKKEVEHL